MIHQMVWNTTKFCIYQIYQIYLCVLKFSNDTERNAQDDARASHVILNIPNFSLLPTLEVS